MTNSVTQDMMANAIRALAIDGVEAAKSGHPGMPMGAADMATALWTRVLKFDAADPHWPDRDRFVLSAGHGSMLLYALLYLTGYAGMTADDLRNFRQVGSKTPGHPEYGHTVGVETTTGPLGQGIATAVGMAIAERHLAAEFGDDLVDHHTYVICGDGDLMEGVSQEAIALAGHLKLARLIVLFDDNQISIDGPVSLSDSVDQIARFESAGWAAVRVDGHDQDAIVAALEAAKKSDRPTLVACRTTIGFGSPNRAGTSKAHGEPLGPDEAKAAKAQLGWTAAPFEVPAELTSAWRAAGSRGAEARKDWQKRFDAAGERKAEFERRLARKLKPEVSGALSALIAKHAADKPSLATRKASEAAIEAIAPHAPELMLGSADLTPSNNVKAKSAASIAPGSYGGRYIHYGIREHGMVAAMNGLTLHGGIIPGGATFLVFSDYCRPSIRLAALMGVQAIYVFTHDSIGLGEDGPTHQPVEHLAALRAMPNLLVIRPADAIETAEAWAVALEHTSGPTLLALTRQNLPTVRGAGDGNRVKEGAYELAGAENAKATIFASGSEVEIALAARDLLAKDGIPTRVVSVPSTELFAARPATERKAVIGDAPVRIAIEAGVRQGWDAFIGEDGVFVGMHGFGMSGPYKEVFAACGITAQAAADAVRKALAGA
ncbi:MAG: transketolase [Rhodoblastus sp.]|nr:transketolase [Rhodoblastus sp.]